MEGYPTIQLADTPESGEWQFPPLYRVDKKGKLSVWRIGFDGEDNLVMVYGKVDGEMQVNTTQITAKGKRTIQQQAHQDAGTRYKKKINKEGYRPDIEEAEETDEFTQPMLARDWEPGKTRLSYPVAVQPKLDGIRCLAFVDSYGDIILRKRGGKEFFFLDHIRDAASILLSFLPEGTILDGELYSDTLDFSIITSIARKEKKRDEREDELNYYIFDIVTRKREMPYFDPAGKVSRYSLLEEAFNEIDAGPLYQVITDYARDEEEIFELYYDHKEEGYEGIIIRRFDGNYIFGRTSNILKYKGEEKEEEGTVVGMKEGKGPEKGTAVLLLRDPRGNEVYVRFQGSFEMRKEWLLHPELVMDKLATVKYQELSKDGVWRFPVGKAIRDYEEV